MYGMFQCMRRLFALFIIFSILLPTVLSANLLVLPAHKPLAQPTFKSSSEGAVSAIPVHEGSCTGDIRSESRKPAIRHSPQGIITGFALQDFKDLIGSSSFRNRTEGTGLFGLPTEWGLTSIRLARADR